MRIDDKQAIIDHLKVLTKDDIFRATRAIVSTVKSKDFAPARCQIVAKLCLPKLLSPLLPPPPPLPEPSLTNNPIVCSLQKAIAHHTNPKGGTRPKFAEHMVQSIATAAWFGTTTDGTISTNEMVTALGCQWFVTKLGQQRAVNLIDEGKLMSELKRKLRRDKVQLKVITYVWQFNLRISRLDSNIKPKEVINPVTGEEETVESHIFPVNGKAN